MEQSPKDHRLFHYTKRLDHLRGMLRGGFWPRYVAEDFTWLFDQPTFIAFPVVCFCDIPMAAASDHRGRYGSYAVAMPKMWATSRDINPVWYIHVATSIYFHFRHIARHPARATLSTIPSSVKPLLPFLKQTVGSQPDRSGRHSGMCELLAFEEELEWRHTPQCLIDRWKFGYDRQIVTDADHEVSESNRLSLDHEDIDSVYVPTEADREDIIGEFPTLSGKVEVRS